MSEVSPESAWIERAEEDFLMARSALRHKTPLTSPACFHAQQCAEKYLKAVLIERHAAFPKTHDLVMLATLCEDAAIPIPINSKELNTLNDYSVQVRYPGDNPTVEDAQDAFRIAKDVRRFARGLLNLR